MQLNPDLVAIELFSQSLDDLKSISRLLYQDFRSFGDAIYLRDSPSSAQDPLFRAMTRAFFAYVEGVTFHLKQLALNAPLIGHLRPGEANMLDEIEYFIADGALRQRSAKISTMSNIKFAFDTFARVFEVPNVVFSDHRWQVFREGLKVRDRLTHPKKVDQLHLTDADYENVLVAAKWFDEVTTALHNTASANFEKKLLEHPEIREALRRHG